MGFETDMATLTQKYLAEVKGEQLTIEEIQSRPRWKRVWFWWLAMEHYDGKKLPMTQKDCKQIYGD